MTKNTMKKIFFFHNKNSGGFFKSFPDGILKLIPIASRSSAVASTKVHRSQGGGPPYCPQIHKQESGVSFKSGLIYMLVIFGKFLKFSKTIYMVVGLKNCSKTPKNHYFFACGAPKRLEIQL